VPRLIFLGAPGAGKGTQAQELAIALAIPHISTGDLLRSAVANQTPLGTQAKSFMDRGELVPDGLVLGMIRDRVHQSDCQSGWILDGFPRNVAQAGDLDTLLQDLQQDCDRVINLDVPDDVIVVRLLARGRADDTEDVIRRRLQVYHDQTAPLISFYHDRQKLSVVNGNQAIDQVMSDLKAAIAA
jgi:adenylate kinase